MSPREPAIRPALSSRWGALLASGIIVLAAVAVYHNSFSGPFILDDSTAITTNPSIKHWAGVLSPPASSPTGGRPVVNLTFALNYALGGSNVWGYHAFNLLVHALAGLALLGLVRRTLLRPALKGRFGAAALPLALAVTVIWLVHPLQTEAVTYISQRAESLMGLFYLLTLYCFVRYTDETGGRREAAGERSDDRQSRAESRELRVENGHSLFRPLASSLWALASIFACLLGTMSKEIIVTAPVMVLLYDRTFVAGSFCQAWRLRWRYYLGLACSWLLLARLMTNGLGKQSVGFDLGVTWWSYALTSCRSVVLYLKLAVWPHPLIFDYGTHIIQHVNEALPYALVLATLLAAVLIALWYRPVIGFAGAWFFMILAPASSVIPVAGQPMAEHRMYLSLAAVVAVVVLGLYRWMGRRSLPVFVTAAVGLGWFSVQRNNDYRNELTMWNDTLAKQPDNARAHNNLGNVLFNMPGHLPNAMAEFQEALRLAPDYVDAHHNLGIVLLNMPGRAPDAMAQFNEVLRLDPDNVEAHNKLGAALLEMPGRLPDAIAQYKAALRLDPDSAETHVGLGNALLKAPGRLPDAIAQFEAALRIEPDSAEMHGNLGNALLNMPGRLPDAIAQCEAALRIDPDFAAAHNNLGNALLRTPGRLPDAMTEYQTALRLKPDYAEAHYNLGNAFFQSNRFTDALGEYERAIQLKPDYTEAHNNLGNTLAELGRLPEAMGQFELALRLNPEFVNARKGLEQIQNALAREATEPKNRAGRGKPSSLLESNNGQGDGK